MTTRARRTRIVVAIDGPAGAGKSTVAKRLAQELGYRLLDTGAIYRATALVARRRGVSWDDEPALAAIAAALDIRFEMRGEANRVFLGDEDVSRAIRTPDMSDGASRVSALPQVRAALLDLQRRLGAQGGVIAEGRDIGTVVFPEAKAKFFLTADERVRARRRHDEMSDDGARPDLKETLRQMRERDTRDSQREVAPLRPADDAVIIDSSGLEVDQVVGRLRRWVRAREQGRTPGIS